MTKLEQAARQALDFIDYFVFNGDNAAKAKSISTALREALAEQSEQEPVAWKDLTYGNLHHQDFGNSTPLYAAPVRTKDLTDDEINELWLTHGQGQMMYIHEKFARAVIAADREKNRE